MIRRVVERMYSETQKNSLLVATYANGDKEVLYFKDFNSGAMIQNIVDRAKKMAIKEFLETGRKGLRGSTSAVRMHRRVQRERGPARHHQPRRLGQELRPEGRADRLHQVCRSGISSSSTSLTCRCIRWLVVARQALDRPAPVSSPRQLLG
jgi:hypothetical protein